MTEGTILRYATAALGFLLGASNTLFGAHFQVPTIVGDFTLTATLIVAELFALKHKDWKTSGVDAEKLFNVLLPMIQQIITGMPKHLSAVDSTGLKQVTNDTTK